MNEENTANKPASSNQPSNDTSNNTAKSAFSSFCFNTFNLNTDDVKLSPSELLYKCRNSRTLVLLVVFIALFFDNMLLTTVVPIIPEYLFELDHPNETAEIQYLMRSKNITYYHDLNLAKTYKINDDFEYFKDPNVSIKLILGKL
jgi:hypothetical protein